MNLCYLFFSDPVLTVLGAAQPPQMKILHYLIDKLHFLSGLYKAGRVEWFLFLPAHLARVSTFELGHGIRYQLACAYSENSNPSVHSHCLVSLSLPPLATHIAPIKDCDQTSWMHRLILVFDGCKCQLVPFDGQRLIYAL